MTKEVPRTSVLRDAELIALLRSVWRYKDLHLCPEAADRIELLATTNEQLVATNEALSISNATLTAERDAAEAKLAKAVEALSPLSAIADAYDENELDDEARKLWGKNLEHENRNPLDEIEIFAGRGGKRLLTLGDAMKARATLAEIKSGVATTPYGLEGESHE